MVIQVDCRAIRRGCLTQGRTKLRSIHFDRIRKSSRTAPAMSDLAMLATQVRNATSALFDLAHDFRDCIVRYYEASRRRVMRFYPLLRDDRFVAENRERWFS